MPRKVGEKDWIVVVPSYNRVDGFIEMTLATLKNLEIGWEKIYLFVANAEEKKKYEEKIKEGKDVAKIVVGEKGIVIYRVAFWTTIFNYKIGCNGASRSSFKIGFVLYAKAPEKIIGDIGARIFLMFWKITQWL